MIKISTPYILQYPAYSYTRYDKNRQNMRFSALAMLQKSYKIPFFSKTLTVLFQKIC